MGKLQVTFRGTSYDVTISGDSLDEIKSEYAKIKKHLEKLTSPKKSPRVKPELTSEGGGFRGLLAQRIMELVSEDFFKIPKTLAEVRAELKNRGYPYGNPAIGMSLLTFVRKKVLRRIFETKNGKKLYLYTNP